MIQQQLRRDGQTKSGHGRGFGTRGGDACKPFPLLSMGRCSGESLVTLEALSFLAPSCVTCIPGVWCVSQLHGETRRVRGWVPCFPQGRQEPVRATSKGSLGASHRIFPATESQLGAAWGTWRLCLGSLVGTGLAQSSSSAAAHILPGHRDKDHTRGSR